MLMLYAKALHIVFVVTWFAGIFYLPRLFVYHAMAAAEADAASVARLKVMERKLFWGIMTPSAVLTVACGLWLLWGYAYAAYGAQGWLHAKLFLVGLLLGYHLWCGRLLAALARDQKRHSHVWYRWFNELPVLGLLLIVWLVVVKPF